MQLRDSAGKKRVGSPFRAATEQFKDKKLTWVLIGVIFIILIFILLAGTLLGSKSSRTEVYKDASGAAGLSAKVDFDCPAPCEQKFNFNVYVFNEGGQQVGVFRPTPEGRVQLALAEGNYVMLIGKQFGQKKEFPQEPLALKNGKVLELGLRY